MIFLPVGSFEVVEVMAMFVSPIRGHVGLRLCEGDADLRGCFSECVQSVFRVCSECFESV